jgi:CelD/BcsL family acetyltransferase involved in cellulose biosynthesis
MSTVSSPPRALEAQVLTDTAQLERLAPEWEGLWCADVRATPFQSPRWLLPWWKHIGRGALLTLAWRDAQGALAGLAPLYVWCDGQGRRQLFPIGIATTDYLDVLARPGCEEAVGRDLLARLDELQDMWDVLEFPQQREGSPLLAAAAAFPRAHVLAGEPNPVLALGEPCRIPRSTLANLRTCRNRAARIGTLAFSTADIHEIPACLDALQRLHGSRWTQRGESGVLADAAVLAAHSESAPLLHAAGLLRLHVLRLDGEIVAVLYALADPPERPARSHYYYIAGFDPRHAFFSPGSLLLAHAIEQAVAEGATAFDFLRGAEPYKYRWGAVDRETLTLRLRAA